MDILNDALVCIKNATTVGKSECIVRYSKLIGRVLRVMQECGYINSFEFVEDGRGGKFKVLRGNDINSCGIIKPRFSVKKTEFEKYEARYLPGQNFGLIILTTTAGVMSHDKAKELGIGGKLLAYVY